MASGSEFAEAILYEAKFTTWYYLFILL